VLRLSVAKGYGRRSTDVTEGRHPAVRTRPPRRCRGRRGASRSGLRSSPAETWTDRPPAPSGPGSGAPLSARRHRVERLSSGRIRPATAGPVLRCVYRTTRGNGVPTVTFTSRDTSVSSVSTSVPAAAEGSAAAVPAPTPMARGTAARPATTVLREVWGAGTAGFGWSTWASGESAGRGTRCAHGLGRPERADHAQRARSRGYSGLEESLREVLERDGRRPLRASGGPAVSAPSAGA